MKILKYIPIFLLYIFYILALATCGGGSGSDDGGRKEDTQITFTVSGTITLPAPVIDEDFYVNIDNDHNGSNGCIESVSGKANSTSFTYSISDVPEGTYWIYGAVNTSEGQIGPWEEGDYVGDQQITVNGNVTVNLTFELYQDEERWQTVFEDNFDGAAGSVPDATNWTQHESTPPAYSLTGSGELEISGEEEEEQDNGATFIYNSSVDHNRIKISTRFRTELESNFKECNILFVLNSSGKGRYLFFIGDEQEDGYTMIIAKQYSDDSTEILQMATDSYFISNYIFTIEAENNNGYLMFRLLDDEGNLLNTIQTNDSSFTNGQCGFKGELIIGEGASRNQSIFFDYFKIETND